MSGYGWKEGVEGFGVRGGCCGGGLVGGLEGVHVVLQTDPGEEGGAEDKVKETFV